MNDVMLFEVRLSCKTLSANFARCGRHLLVQVHVVLFQQRIGEEDLSTGFALVDLVLSLVLLGEHVIRAVHFIFVNLQAFLGAEAERAVLTLSRSHRNVVAAEVAVVDGDLSEGLVTLVAAIVDLSGVDLRQMCHQFVIVLNDKVANVAFLV